MNLWPRVTSFENLYEAFRRARRAKRSRPDVAAFEYNLESNLLALQRDLLEGTYRPGGYRNFVVHEPAGRKISAGVYGRSRTRRDLRRSLVARVISASISCGRRAEGLAWMFRRSLRNALALVALDRIAMSTRS